MEALETRNPKEEFDSLVAQLNREFRKLRQRCLTLKQENEQLRRELEQAGQKDTGAFDHLPETGQYVLRQQIRGLINKIDHHLANQA